MPMNDNNYRESSARYNEALDNTVSPGSEIGSGQTKALFISLNVPIDYSAVGLDKAS